MAGSRIIEPGQIHYFLELSARSWKLSARSWIAAGVVINYCPTTIAPPALYILRNRFFFILPNGLFFRF